LATVLKHRLGFLKRFGFGLLRRGSRLFRASTDLFDDYYEPRADWKSGLQNGGHLLYSLVRCLYPDVVVEIGSARGKSSCCMALACKHNGKGKVYAIDPHIKNAWSEIGTSGDNEHFMRTRLKEYNLEPYCEVIRDLSTNAAKTWNRPIDLIFIDGSHSYEGVKSDFDLFQPWFTDKALVVFHDTTWDYENCEEARRKFDLPEELGVPKFLQELREAGYPSITFPAMPGITVLDPHVGGYDFIAGKGWPSMQAKN
jgi:predicted O-methyltransferase YrrM